MTCQLQNKVAQLLYIKVHLLYMHLLRFKWCHLWALIIIVCGLN